MEERGMQLLDWAPKHATLLEINSSGYQPKECWSDLINRPNVRVVDIPATL